VTKLEAARWAQESPTVLHEDDFVAVLDGGQAVGNDNCGPFLPVGGGLQELAQILAHLLLGLAVECC
jgi:hypothetical protein